MIGLVFMFLFFFYCCCLDEVPAQGATGSWVVQGLVLQCFPLGEFSLCDTL